MSFDDSFWSYLQKIVDESEIIIDRPKGSHHPRYPEAPVYPLDYGYLDGTSSMDGEGIDCFLGSLDDGIVSGVLCTIDMLKRDSEIKVLISCTDDEMVLAHSHLNSPGFMKALLIKR